MLTKFWAAEMEVSFTTDELILTLVSLIRSTDPRLLRNGPSGIQVDFATIERKESHTEDERLLLRLRNALEDTPEAQGNAKALELSWAEGRRLADGESKLSCEVLGRAEDIGRLGWAMVYQLTWNGQLVEAVAVCRRAMAPLGDAQRLVGKSDRLLATPQRTVLVDHERLHAAEIPQRTLLLERLGCLQADANSIGKLGVAEMVGGLHVQHVR